MAFAFGRATPSLRQAPSRCLDNPVLGNIIFSLDGEHHLLLKVLHFRVEWVIKNKDDPLQKSWSVVEGSAFYLACRNSVRGDSLIQSMSVLG